MLFYILVALCALPILALWLNAFSERPWVRYFLLGSFTALLAYAPYLFYTLVSSLGVEFNNIGNVLSDHPGAIIQLIQRVSRI